jgi:predicted nucleic acid-binding protein
VRRGEEREKVLGILRSLPQLPLDASAAEARIIYAQRTKEKTKVDPEGAMLAGIATQNNEPLPPRNKKDFAGIPQLKLETY